ncbi:hypothetical protein D8M34_06100 [Microbacterium sp. HSID17254]|uniref:hypothetical protein n=1 Tax=Microbacterium sp. HSID17254 TaxID=2419509 RepID=UPI000F86DB35|nr:hypothetical protein [Microbacterium sp. HSID17254]RUQ07040.1 hypothetical protein D8M34_06100 [Microbacterium sp. HSID17254]
MTGDAMEFPPPVPAPRTGSMPLPMRRPRMTKANLIANLAADAVCLIIAAGGAYYVMAGMP